MRLHPDCVRDVLVCIEDKLIIDADGHKVTRPSVYWGDIFTDEKLNKDHLIEDIQYTILQLKSAEMITAHVQEGGSNRGVLWVEILDITWAGHELLGTLRGEELWEETKTVAEKLGAFSIKTLGTIASAVVNAKIDQYFQGGNLTT